MTGLRSAAGIAAMLLAVACTAAVPPTLIPAAAARSTSTLSSAISHRLYFGRSIPDGGTVTDRDWDTFLADVVTPRFPDGFTVWQAEGQWRGEGGVVIREASFVLEIVHPSDPVAEVAVREIASEYRRRFRQEAVLWVRDEVLMSIEEDGQ